MLYRDVNQRTCQYRSPIMSSTSPFTEPARLHFVGLFLELQQSCTRVTIDLWHQPAIWLARIVDTEHRIDMFSLSTQLNITYLLNLSAEYLTMLEASEFPTHRRELKDNEAGGHLAIWKELADALFSVPTGIEPHS